jgi:vacuolar iron transporter family protein
MARNDQRKEMKKNSHFLNWKNECDSELIYQTLSTIEGNTSKGKLFKSLAQESLVQGRKWKTLGDPMDLWVYRPGLKIKLVNLTLKKFGPKHLLDVLSGLKIRGLSLYRVGTRHELVREGLEPLHEKIKSGSSLRAATFGINDGLVSNAGLVFAMVGAQSSGQTIILTGIAGLLAGGFSMATGEYISVKSQAELFENQMTIEKEELLAFPEEEAKELSLIYQAKGMDPNAADRFAGELIKDQEKALDTLAREELGINPEELGSPIKAATASFVAFSIGAAIPLLPFTLLSVTVAIYGSLIASLTSLFLIGILISFFTGKSALLSGLRMCLLGLFSGGGTYLIGHLIGVSNP